ncbi:MAG: polysaccharide lyase, partial [Alistipes sp.]|nr:polysaccharide lyase [Alistipes sp.]
MGAVSVIPDSVQQRVDRQTAEIERLSDAAWEKALPIVEQEEKEFGRVYRPWASKPADLLKAEIPAFPG